MEPLALSFVHVGWLAASFPGTPVALSVSTAAANFARGATRSLLAEMLVSAHAHGVSRSAAAARYSAIFTLEPDP